MIQDNKIAYYILNPSNRLKKNVEYDETTVGDEIDWDGGRSHIVYAIVINV